MRTITFGRYFDEPDDLAEFMSLQVEVEVLENDVELREVDFESGGTKVILLKKGQKHSVELRFAEMLLRGKERITFCSNGNDVVDRWLTQAFPSFNFTASP
ncbi:MAG TPA: hypothetical protein VK149_12395 [Sideroxyarcus sp.]|nr:hypothetical protein [Sideroxyarcus sp.]